MYLIETPWHIISATVIFLIGIFIASFLARKFLVPTLVSLALYLWHTFMCFVYIIYAFNNVADANRYFSSNNLDFINISFGTKTVEIITSLLKIGFDLSYVGCFLVFNIIGFVGLLSFAGALRSISRHSSPMIQWFVKITLFLPSVSFWSSAIGKDAFSFMAAGLSLWASLNVRQRKTTLITAILIMLLVRPHMAGIMVISISIAILFDKNASLQIKASLASLSMVTMAFLIPYALNYAGLGQNVSPDLIEHYLSTKQSHNMSGGSSLDITSMSLPVKMFTYVFRPLPYEAHNITSLLASIDNVLLLILFFLGVRHLRNYKIKQDPANRLFMWCYALGSLTILSLTTANLGIAMRQKWMFLPMLIYLLVSALVLSKQRKYYKVNNEQN